jgi:hypothetical protein
MATSIYPSARARRCHSRHQRARQRWPGTCCGSESHFSHNRRPSRPSLHQSVACHRDYIHPAPTPRRRRASRGRKEGVSWRPPPRVAVPLNAAACFTFDAGPAVRAAPVEAAPLCTCRAAPKAQTQPLGQSAPRVQAPEGGWHSGVARGAAGLTSQPTAGSGGPASSSGIAPPPPPPPADSPPADPPPSRTSPASGTGLSGH